MQSLIEQPEAATVHSIAAELAGAQPAEQGAPAQAFSAGSLWISPAPSVVRMRLFCLPYAGGVSENVFSRHDSLSSLSSDTFPLLWISSGTSEGCPAHASLPVQLRRSSPSTAPPLHIFAVHL